MSKLRTGPRMRIYAYIHTQRENREKSDVFAILIYYARWLAESVTLGARLYYSQFLEHSQLRKSSISCVTRVYR